MGTEKKEKNSSVLLVYNNITIIGFIMLFRVVLPSRRTQSSGPVVPAGTDVN